MEEEQFVLTASELSELSFNQISTTSYRFILQKQIKLGQGIYITGNIPQLGEWKTAKALRLSCHQASNWIIDLDIPIETEIQYKFFVSSFDHHYDQPQIKIEGKNWIGNQKGNNFKLKISEQEAINIQETRTSKQLKVMSFNIRCEIKDDQNQFHWKQRKENCIEVIRENYPSVIGIQEPRRTQVPYLCQKLSHLYSFIGAQRDDSPQTEQVGIFYDKQRFVLVEYDFKWINETGQRGVPGFGARLPRLYTYIILEDTYVSEKKNGERNLIMVTNVHLDHESSKARTEGVKLMALEIQRKRQYFNNLKDVFVIGDFNTHQVPAVFNPFSTIEPSLESIRVYFDRLNLRNRCDYKYTFNGFRKYQGDVNDPTKVIDHLFMHTEIYEAVEFKAIREMKYRPQNPSHNIVSDHFPVMGTFRVV